MKLWSCLKSLSHSSDFSFFFVIDEIPLGLPHRFDYPYRYATLPRVPAAADTFEVNHFYRNLALLLGRVSWEAFS